MTYALFDNTTGAVIDRTPTIVEGKISFQFNRAPANATAFIKAENGDTFYRDLNEDGTCEIPAREGVLKVYVKTFGTSFRTWKCEELAVSRVDSDRYLLSPNDTNLPVEFVRLKQENQEIREKQKELEKQIAETNVRIDKMLEGWDIT